MVIPYYLTNLVSSTDKVTIRVAAEKIRSRRLDAEVKVKIFAICKIRVCLEGVLGESQGRGH